MKCIKNQKTNEIIRVDDKVAYNMVGNAWQYVPKSEWKALRKPEKTEEQVTQTEKKTETVSDKQLRRKKLKEKQRN